MTNNNLQFAPPLDEEKIRQSEILLADEGFSMEDIDLGNLCIHDSHISSVYLVEHATEGTKVLKWLNGGLIAIQSGQNVIDIAPIVSQEPFLKPRVVGVFKDRLTDWTDFDEKHWWYVMDYFNGLCLSEIKEQSGSYMGFPKRVGLGLLASLDSLEIVHKADLRNQDVKPGNIVANDFQGAVIDYDLIRTPEAIRAHAETGNVAGTPPYIPRRSFTGGVPTRLDDLESFALTLYECFYNKDYRGKIDAFADSYDYLANALSKTSTIREFAKLPPTLREPVHFLLNRNYIDEWDDVSHYDATLAVLRKGLEEFVAKHERKAA